RHYDLMGLALVAAGVYSAFVLYLDWEGGPVGEGMITALEYAVGKLAYLAPIALFAGGVALIARPMLEARRALGAGAALIFLALALALAAETLGLGPDRPVRHGYFEPRFYQTHGGVVGEVLYWASTQLFQRLGAQILAVLLLICGVLLASGTTIAGLFSGMGGAARHARESTREMARTVRETAPIEWGDAPGDEIQITRAGETEAFATEELAEP